MTNGREQILGSIRKSLKRGPVTEGRAAELRAKLDAHARNVIPQRAAGLEPPPTPAASRRLQPESQCALR